MSSSTAYRESYLIRRVASLEELEKALDLLGALFTPPITTQDRKLADVLSHFPQDRPLMVIAGKGGRIVGGAIGFGSTLRLIAVDPGARGKGLGRRLLQTFEVGAMKQGIRMISLGALEQAKGFYARMGYRGKSSWHKELPLPGRVREHRLRKLETMLGDLDEGPVVQVDEAGRIPPLF